MMRSPLCAAVAAILTAAAGGASASEIDFTPDFGASFAIEGEHVAHFALRLKGVDQARLDAAGKDDLRAAMWPKLWKYACSLPQRNAKVFQYVRHPNGVIELNMMDETGNSISLLKVRWSTCRN